METSNKRLPEYKIQNKVSQFIACRNLFGSKKLETQMEDN